MQNQAATEKVIHALGAGADSKTVQVIVLKDNMTAAVLAIEEARVAATARGRKAKQGSHDAAAKTEHEYDVATIGTPLLPAPRVHACRVGVGQPHTTHPTQSCIGRGQGGCRWRCDSHASARGPPGPTAEGASLRAAAAGVP